MPDTPTTVFISYARVNTDFVDHLEADLQMRGFYTWVDRRKLEGGQDWLDNIQQAIERCQVLLVVLSPDAVKSTYVLMEYRYALRMGKLVIPLQFQLCPKVPIDLNGIQWIDFIKLYDNGLSELLVVLSRMENAEPEMQIASPSSAESQRLFTSEEKEPDLVIPQPAPPPGPGLDGLYRAEILSHVEVAPRYTFNGHTDDVYSIAWSPDGRYLASGSRAGFVHVWDMQTGCDKLIYDSPIGTVYSIAWSPDGKYIASGDSGGFVRVWKVPTDHESLYEVSTYTSRSEYASSVAWSPDGKYIASGHHANSDIFNSDYDGRVKVWKFIR